MIVSNLILSEETYMNKCMRRVILMRRLCLVICIHWRIENSSLLLLIFSAHLSGNPQIYFIILTRYSLQQIISCESCSPEGVEALRPFIPEIWVQLSKHCQCAEEGSRNVVSTEITITYIPESGAMLWNLTLALFEGRHSKRFKQKKIWSSAHTESCGIPLV